MDAALAYEHHAAEFLRRRDQSLVGADVVRVWCTALPHRAEVLELACGAGLPITRTLQEAQCAVWGVDSSPTLTRFFSERFPSFPIDCSRVQESTWFNRQFDAIVAVGLLFLLTEHEQISLLQRFNRHLRAGGRALFSSPYQIASWVDVCTDSPCRSLGWDTYQACLVESGFSIVASLTDSGGNHYFDVMRNR